jgi:hypothetical protein
MTPCPPQVCTNLPRGHLITNLPQAMLLSIIVGPHPAQTTLQLPEIYNIEFSTSMCTKCLLVYGHIHSSLS